MELWLNYAAAYVATTWLFFLFGPGPRLKDFWMAASSLGVTYLCFFSGGEKMHYIAFAISIVFTLWCYLMLVLYRDSPNVVFALITMGGPMVILAFLKIEQINFIIGFSYLTFRVSYLAYEMHTQRIRLPGLLRYLAFIFFPLTFLIGPINPYRNFSESLDAPSLRRTPASRCLGRILVGILKCYIFALLFKGLSFFSYWQPYYEHNFTGFTISSISTALYIYFNFSGACDIMIGASALMGIHVQENFRNPFFSRNLVEYWTRNHITLTQVVRDIIFTPSTLWVARLTHGRYMLFFTSLITLLAFFIVGIWHGTEMGFILFGLMHGIGVVIVNIYGTLLRYMPARMQHCATAPAMRYVSTFITFMYVCYSSAFFGSSAETLELMKHMLSI